MNSKFHNKYHRFSHNGNPIGGIETSNDELGTAESPFLGDFVVDGDVEIIGNANYSNIFSDILHVQNINTYHVVGNVVPQSPLDVDVVTTQMKIGDCIDVVISDLNDGDVLVYNSGVWANGSITTTLLASTTSHGIGKLGVSNDIIYGSAEPKVFTPASSSTIVGGKYITDINVAVLRATGPSREVFSGGLHTSDMTVTRNIAELIGPSLDHIDDYVVLEIYIEVHAFQVNKYPVIYSVEYPDGTMRKVFEASHNSGLDSDDNLEFEQLCIIPIGPNQTEFTTTWSFGGTPAEDVGIELELISIIPHIVVGVYNA